jgi:hypothetical protein
VSHSIARALLVLDPSLKDALKKEGLLTRDSRMVERKKPGRPKARKRFHSQRDNTIYIYIKTLFTYYVKSVFFINKQNKFLSVVCK